MMRAGAWRTVFAGCAALCAARFTPGSGFWDVSDGRNDREDEHMTTTCGARGFTAKSFKAPREYILNHGGRTGL